MADRIYRRNQRNRVNEAPIEYGDYPERMHPRTQQRIEDPEGIYAKNRAFKGGVRDVERMTEKRFKEIVDYVKRYYGTEMNVTDPSVKRAIQMEQMMAVRQAMTIEMRHKEPLRDLALELAAKEEGWLPYSKTLEEAISEGLVIKKRNRGGGVVYEFDYVNMLTFLGEQRVDPNEFRINPEEKKKLELPKNFSFDVDELTPDEQRELEIEKRNVINALIQGKGKRGQFSYQMVKDRLDAIDPNLYALYNKIMGANDLMYFTDEDLIEALGGNAAGSAGKTNPSDDDDDDSESGEEEQNDTYFANGVIFPILLHELFKAFSMIQTRVQWKDMDPSMAMDVMGQTDTMKNEPMNFRVGAELVRKMRSLLPEELVLDREYKKYIPFFERILYSIPAEEFLKDVIANVVSEDPNDNAKAQKRFDDILNKAVIEFNKYKGESEYEDEDEDEFSF